MPENRRERRDARRVALAQEELRQTVMRARDGEVDPLADMRSRPAPNAATRGGVGTDGVYTWGQSLSDITLRVFLPPGTRADDIIVEWSEKWLAVRVRDATKPTSTPATTLIDAELTKKTAESGENTLIWTLEEDDVAEIIVPKKRVGKYWDAPFKHEKLKINALALSPFDESTDPNQRAMRERGESEGAGGIDVISLLVNVSQSMPTS